MMLDVDYFKRYNDAYGHQAGDYCLQKVVEVLTSSLINEPGASVIRYGGEEFLIIAPNFTEIKAMQKAEEIQKRFKILHIPHRHSLVSDYVTLSIGICCAVPRADLSANDIIYRADQALYVAKNQGRNRIVVLPLKEDECE